MRAVYTKNQSVSGWDASQDLRASFGKLILVLADDSKGIRLSEKTQYTSLEAALAAGEVLLPQRIAEHTTISITPELYFQVVNCSGREVDVVPYPQTT